MLINRLIRRVCSTQDRPRVAWVWHKDYAVLEGWEHDHRFNMWKYPGIFERLVFEGIIDPASVWKPSDPKGDAWLHLAHCPAYVKAYCTGKLESRLLRRIGLPWSPEMVRAIRLEVAGTVLAAKLALKCGVACSLGGGTHHAHRDFGQGFNVFNDLALAAITLLEQNLVRSALVVDLDVHQGDGTAAITRGDSRITTFSMHSAKAFPLRKAQSSLDIGLPNAISDNEYLCVLREHLPKLLDAQLRPSIVLYDAGVDVHKSDSVRNFCRGHLSLTSEGICLRDEYVLQESLRRNLPVATVIGGGYSRNISELIGRHCIHAQVVNSMVGRDCFHADA